MIRFPVAALTISVCFVVLLFSAGESFALPPCQDEAKTWHNCSGTWTYDDTGDKYVGEWRDDKMHGKGTFTFGPSSQWAGDKYVGEYRDGNFNGQGTYIYASGEKYVGEWRDNKRNGQGTSTLADGNKYVGEYRDGIQHGQGTYTYAAGHKYVGEFRGNKYHGQGTLIFADGNKYVGEWRDGSPNGQGTATSADGTVQEGIYKDGEFQYARKDPKVEERRKAEREAERRKQERIAREKQEQERIAREHTAPPELDAIEAPYVALKNANVREQPDAKSPRVATLSKGSEVTALGKVKGKNWYLVSRDGKKLGYVFGPLLSELGTERITREKRERIEKLPPCQGDDESKWQNCEGILTFHSGKIYVGVFKDGIFDGENEHGVKWVGGYKNGTMHGQGTLTFPHNEEKLGDWSGAEYVGAVSLGGKSYGQGTLTFVNGNKYVGEWRDDKKHGQGTHTWADGTKYVGEWRDDRRNGRGTLNNANRSKYVGEFRHSKFNGQGTYTYADGSFDEGVWKNDEFQYARKDPKVEEEREAKKREAERLEKANDNIRLALDILNFTVSGSKKSREDFIVLDAENCIFQLSAHEYKGVIFRFSKTLRVNNIIPETVNFETLYYTEGTLIKVKFRGDNPVWGDSTSGTMDLYSTDLGFLERVRKAWGLLFSKACKGASPSEF